MAYSLREKERKNYRAIENPSLPRAKKARKDSRLYELEVVEEDEYTGRVKVHYLGYDSRYDEWRNKEDVVDLQPRHQGPPMPFHLHKELAYQVKLSLHSSRRSDPDTRVEVPFDYFLYEGGLKQAGTLLKRSHYGHDIYGIKKYQDLEPILGSRWHLRVLNKQMDFCYVILDSVQFHLHCRQDVTDFHPDLDPEYSIDGGYTVIFRFVRGDGVKEQFDDIGNSLVNIYNYCML